MAFLDVQPARLELSYAVVYARRAYQTGLAIDTESGELSLVETEQAVLSDCFNPFEQPMTKSGNR